MLKRIALGLALLFPSAAWAADSTVSALTAASALNGAELSYCVQGGADRKCTFTQVQSFIASGTGVATALTVNIGSAGAFVVNGGALGTPSSGTLTSATGLPISTGLTGAGTGVLTALGVNVGSAGAFITFNGAGGTPSSMVGTNITGTAAGLTAGSVTTNANLTGPITSVGNATSIASQTGTGTTFVTSVGPTITGGLTVSQSSFALSGNISAPAWTTAGIRYANVTATLTDTTSSGTVANARTDNFGGNTIAASSATVFTNYFSAYFTNPIAGTNVTLTNKSALGADSISVGGAAQGTDALAVTGTANLSGSITTAGSVVAGAASQFSGTLTANNSILVRGGNGANRGIALGALGVADISMGSDIGVAWTSSTNPSGTRDTNLSRVSAGVVGVGTGAAGSVAGTISAATVLTGSGDAASSTGGALQVAGGASVAKRFWIPAITTSAGTQTAVLCQSSGGEMIADSVACLASGAQFKNILGPMEDGALDKLMKLPMDRWAYKAEGNFKSADWTRERIGPIAQDVAAMDKRLAGYDNEGNVRTFSTEQLLAFTIKAVQELNAKVGARR